MELHPPSHSCGVSLSIWDHSVTCTCHPTQVNTSRLNPSQTGWYLIYLLVLYLDLLRITASGWIGTIGTIYSINRLQYRAYANRNFVSNNGEKNSEIYLYWLGAVQILGKSQTVFYWRVAFDVHFRSFATLRPVAWMSWRVPPACHSRWRTVAGPWELSRSVSPWSYGCLLYTSPSPRD